MMNGEVIGVNKYNLLDFYYLFATSRIKQDLSYNEDGFSG